MLFQHPPKAFPCPGISICAGRIQPRVRSLGLRIVVGLGPGAGAWGWGWGRGRGRVEGVKLEAGRRFGVGACGRVRAWRAWCGVVLCGGRGRGREGNRCGEGRPARPHQLTRLPHNSMCSLQRQRQSSPLLASPPPSSPSPPAPLPPPPLINPSLNLPLPSPRPHHNHQSQGSPVLDLHTAPSPADLHAPNYRLPMPAPGAGA